MFDSWGFSVLLVFTSDIVDVGAHVLRWKLGRPLSEGVNCFSKELARISALAESSEIRLPLISSGG